MSRSAPSASRSAWTPIHRLITLATMFSLVFGGLLLTMPGQASAQSTATVQDHLNLRTEPHTGAPILAVMPPGATVTLNGDAQSGFYPVSYGNLTGFAHSDWIGTGAPTAPTTSTGATGTAYVSNGPLNMRSGPSMGNSVITLLPTGAAISLTGEVSGGFLGVVYNGTSGWAHSDYIGTSGAPAPQPSNPGTSNPVGDTVVGTMTTTDALNMRSGASTSNGIITTIPYGATVEIMGSAVDGWYPVRYAGNKGWSSGAWLTGSAAAPAPSAPDPAPSQPSPAPSNPVAVGDTVVGTMYVGVGLNLRSGPSTSYQVITVMPAGATVSVMGDSVDGFFPLSFAGTKGWASAGYLNTTPSTTAPTPATPSGYSTDEIIQIIYASADKYGQPRADMLRVAQCESVLNPSVVNPYSGASGLFQFMPGTWATTPFANEDIFDPVMNAEAAGWMWANGRRNEWVCQ